MKSGQLRRRVQLQASTDTADSLGQPIPSWSTIATYWAQIKPLRGREDVNAQQKKPEVSHRVTMRYTGRDQPILATHRFLYVDPITAVNRYLKIIDVLNVDEMNRTYEIDCQEIVSTS